MSGEPGEPASFAYAICSCDSASFTGAACSSGNNGSSARTPSIASFAWSRSRGSAPPSPAMPSRRAPMLTSVTDV